ncbi:MAG: penicillin acylase family protein [Comamonadaceae bacterium]|nr:penicillin acylase family protein [Comamonadaceae bacterium]
MPPGARPRHRFGRRAIAYLVGRGAIALAPRLTIVMPAKAGIQVPPSPDVWALAPGLPASRRLRGNDESAVSRAPLRQAACRPPARGRRDVGGLRALRDLRRDPRRVARRVQRRALRRLGVGADGGFGGLQQRLLGRDLDGAGVQRRAAVQAERVRVHRARRRQSWHRRRGDVVEMRRRGVLGGERIPAGGADEAAGVRRDDVVAALGGGAGAAVAAGQGLRALHRRRLRSGGMTAYRPLARRESSAASVTSCTVAPWRTPAATAGRPSRAEPSRAEPHGTAPHRPPALAGARPGEPSWTPAQAPPTLARPRRRRREPNPTKENPMRHWLRSRLRCLLLPSAAAAVALVAMPATAADGEAVFVAGLRAPATVLRDVDGIAHVRANTERDALFMQGWLHAQDRLFQADTLRRTASGTLAELVGASALSQDVQLRTIGLRRAAERSLAAASPQLRDGLAAYAAGVNAWIAANPLPAEYARLEADPRRTVDRARQPVDRQARRVPAVVRLRHRPDRRVR